MSHLDEIVSADIRELEAKVFVVAAECSLLAAQLDCLACALDVARANSLHAVATEIRRADSSLRAIVRLSKATGEPR